MSKINLKELLQTSNNLPINQTSVDKENYLIVRHKSSRRKCSMWTNSLKINFSLYHL